MRKPGDTLPSNTLITAHPGSVLSPRYVCGVSPCLYFLGQPYDLVGAGRGISGLAGKGKHVEGLRGTHRGS